MLHIKYPSRVGVLDHAAVAPTETIEWVFQSPLPKPPFRIQIRGGSVQPIDHTPPSPFVDTLWLPDSRYWRNSPPSIQRVLGGISQPIDAVSGAGTGPGAGTGATIPAGPTFYKLAVRCKENDPVSMRRAIETLDLARGQLDSAMPVLKATEYSGAGTFFIWNENCPRPYRLVLAWVVCTNGVAGTVYVSDDSSMITDSATHGINDKAIVWFTSIDDAYHRIAARGTAKIVSSGSGDGIVYTVWLPVE